MLKLPGDLLPAPLQTPPAPHLNDHAIARQAFRESIDNDLLAALPRAEYRQMLKRLEPVTLTFGEVLFETGDTIDYVYFPGVSLGL